MKNKGSARSARTKAKKIHISQGGRDLTAQAGLIPVVKFLGVSHLIYLKSGLTD